MLKFLHRLLNPHCTECADEVRENKVCQSCETLQMQLSIANIEKQRLLEALISKETPQPIATSHGTNNLEEVRKRPVPWRVRQQMLEENDRKTAELFKKKAEEEAALNNINKETENVKRQIDNLERELDIAETEPRSNAEVIQS